MQYVIRRRSGVRHGWGIYNAETGILVKALIIRSTYSNYGWAIYEVSPSLARLNKDSFIRAGDAKLFASGFSGLKNATDFLKGFSADLLPALLEA